MNTHHLPTYARIALIAAVAGLMTACATTTRYYDPNPYHSPRVVYYDYWYYPAIGAYYDPHSHIYIYYEHDHWIRARALPHRMRPHLGHHVTVRSPHDRPYEAHHRHRQEYRPERYRERDHTHHGDNAWIGAPRDRNPLHDRDVRRIESHERDRNGKDRRHEPERGAVAVPPRYREPGVKYPRHTPDNRPKDTPRDREPPAITAPVKQHEKWRQPEIRREKSREPYRSGNVRRDNERRKDHARPGSSAGQSRQHRIPDSRGQQPKTPSKSAPDHRKPTSRTLPTKQDDKGHQRKNRKEDRQHRHREGDDRRGDIKNDDDTTPQKRQRSPFDQYEQYR